jgi:hypothetical protein
VAETITIELPEPLQSFAASKGPAYISRLVQLDFEREQKLADELFEELKEAATAPLSHFQPVLIDEFLAKNRARSPA